jgi:hypothetical protein
VSISPDGRFARVDDERARLSQGWLNTGGGLVRLTRMRRSSRVAGLPAPRPGTRYVVPRVTALAARGRGDLVFPFDELRDADGRVVGARGLAAFRRGLAGAERYRDWRAAVQERRARRRLTKQWLTGVLFAAATALLSGAIGLFPGAVDNARRFGWGAGGQLWTAWLTVGFGAAGAALLIVAAWRWRRRGAMLDDRGTAYVIEEQAIGWQHEEKASVLADIGAQFASVLRVPGPEGLGERWRWQADDQGAPCWDRHTDELVRSFWAVHFNDDQVTRNALFIWAPWPVAMAFGARATARRRGLVLHVRQRPSYGAGGPRQQLRPSDGAHDFLRDKTPRPLNAAAPAHAVMYTKENLTVTIRALRTEPAETRASSAGAGGRGAQAARGSHAEPAGTGDTPATGAAAGPALLLLLVRLVQGPIGPIPLDLRAAADVTLSISASLAGRVIPTGTHTIPVAEWRLAPASPAGQAAAHVPWDAFPAAAECIAGWVVEQAAAHPGHTVLLATRIPQELPVGLGIQLGQRSQDWPRDMYPVYFESGRLVVPDLQLGAESVRAERA